MVTQHYERRDEGFFVVGSADFFGDKSSERRLYDGGEFRGLIGLDEATQQLYMDLRSRAESSQCNEMGRCRRCDEYIPPLTVTGAEHICADGATLVCPTCNSSVFKVSVLDSDRCAFCDGTEGR